jgi:amidohydrolase
MSAEACRDGLPSREDVLAAVDAGLPEVLELARWMAAHPELSLEEHETSRRYQSYLRGRGFAVQTGIADLPTAFVASHGPVEAPLVVALIAEMDSLPEIGHACGHNLSGPASLLAASALATVIPPNALQLRLIGSPAEETGVGKRRLVEAGVFDGASAAMMAHASDMRRAHRLFLGNRKFDFTFLGRAAHAAAYPERGVNALDALVALFVAVGLLRQQLPDGVRVHGVIREGGTAPNVIPERARAEFWIRALEEPVLDDAVVRVRACAEGAAASVGAGLETLELECSSPPMRPCLALAEVYGDQLRFLGLEESNHGPERCIGSSDITHVSRVVPTIHPNFPIGRDLQLHTRAFAAAAASPDGERGLTEAARSLALTIHALAQDGALRQRIRQGYQN